MNTIYNLVNELGAQLNEEERKSAIIDLNNLYLNGYSETPITIKTLETLQQREGFMLKGQINMGGHIQNLRKNFLIS